MPVEFLSAEPPEPVRPDSVPPDRQRHATWLRVAAAVVVLAALVVWALTRPDAAHHPAAAPATTAPETAPSARPSTGAAPGSVIALHCVTGAPLANELESAMWHYFRGIAIRNLGAYRCVRGSGPSGRVLFQAVTGRYRGVNIDLEARLRTAHGVGADISPRLGSAHGRYQLLAQIKAISVDLEVTVNAYGRPGARVPGDRMQRLCDFVSLNLVL